MINANKERLVTYFQGSNQFVVPFFQRPYVWADDNWQSLWEHVSAVLERTEGGGLSEHFIGTIITKQRPAQMLGQALCDIVDGQQRLTTIALFLRAIGDSAKGDLPNLRAAIDTHLSFRDSRNRWHPRIVPSKNDRAVFEQLVSTGVPDGEQAAESKLVGAYLFFRSKLAEFADDRLDMLRLVLLERVPVISMLLGADDDEQEIFDTINALGVRLTTSELLKNYIFKEDELKSDCTSLWEEVFEDDETQAAFWARPKTAGRVIRTNIEVLLYCYLAIKTGGDIRIEALFKEYKAWLSPLNAAAKREFLAELRDYADIYFNLPSGESLNQLSFADTEERFFHVVENLTVTTIYPLVLYIYRWITSKTERFKILDLLECYLVRRNVCRYTSKNYNTLFIQVIARLEAIRLANGHFGVQELQDIIAGFKDETNLLPDDDEFRDAFHTSPLSNQNAREILFLLALRQVADGLADMPRLSLENYSTEHIMPVKWERHWLTKSMGEEQKAKRSKKIKTLGNLTLVTRRLNSRMQNAAWNEKREFLRPYSALPITTPYLMRSKWDEGAIQARATDLAEVALEAWPTPS